MELKCRNVNDAFLWLVKVFNNTAEDVCGTYGVPVVRKPYSNPNGSGYRIQIDEPVMIHYSHPKERVLFNEARDSNPFFTLYEALWMLAGRNDVAPLAYYNSKVGGYSDDGDTFNGAYGYRWRNHDYRGECIDQLFVIIAHLRRKPESSRAVLAMWNVNDDLLRIDGSKDVCCNLDVVFSIREEYKHWDKVTMPDGTKPLAGLRPTYLDMTVFNRSNDLIWGALGTNYVHFTVLQEYVAAHLGVEVGRYTQATTNLHVYDWNWKPEEWLAGVFNVDPYCLITPNTPPLRPVPLVRDPAMFDEELSSVVNAFKGEERGPRREIDGLTEPFFRHVAAPMFRAFELHKLYQETTEALRMCELIRADDWRIACLNWLKKRVK